MKLLSVLIHKELLEQWRTKKILTIVIVMLFAAIASPIIAKLTPELMKTISVPGLSINLPVPTYLDSLDQFVKNVSQIAVLVLIFVVAGAVSDEKNRKTLEIVLTKPISRAWLILSKFKSYFISVSAIFAVSSIIFYLYTTSTFSGFNLLNFLIMAGCMLVYILMIVATTILASTVVNSSVAAGGIGFVFYILLGTIMGIIEPLKNYSPGVIFTNYKTVVQHGWSGDLLWPLIVSLVIIILSALIAIRVFSRQEIER